MKLFIGLTLLFVICNIHKSQVVAQAGQEYCNRVNLALAGYAQTMWSTITIPVYDYVPLANLDVKMFIENLTITGLQSVRLDCPANSADLDSSNYVFHVENNDILIDISYYNLTGMLDTVEIYGAGPGYVNIENFTAAVYGPTDDHYLFLENSTMLDLWIYRWTVNFEGIMPGTDMGYLFNEFLSMVGPETIDAIDVYINSKYTFQLTNLVNKVLTMVESGFGDVTKPAASQKQPQKQ